MSMGSPKEELEHLKLRLKKVQEKILCEWTGESFIKARLEDVENHKNLLTKGDENIKNLEDAINQYHIQSEKNLEVLRERAEEVAILEKELRKLQITAEGLLEKRSHAQKQFEEKDSLVRKQREDLSTEEQNTSYKIRQLTKGTDYFKDRLGLTFKKVDEEHLQFVFKYIDPDDEERPFVFTVAITEQDSYKVKDCTPEIEGLAALVDQLNNTNNFSKFVITMRKKFKKLVCSNK